jgi:hypothetical protein
LHKGAEEEVDSTEGVVTGKIHEIFFKEYWKDKTCYKCEKKGHPANKCPKKSNNDDDEKSVVSAASSVKKLKKYFKSMKKASATVNTQLEKLKEADYYLSGSEDDDDPSYFQMDAALQFTQVDKEFEPTIVNLFKQAGSSVNIEGRPIGQSVHFGYFLQCILGKQDLQIHHKHETEKQGWYYVSDSGNHYAGLQQGCLVHHKIHHQHHRFEQFDSAVSHHV